MRVSASVHLSMCLGVEFCVLFVAAHGKFILIFDNYEKENETQTFDAVQKKKKTQEEFVIFVSHWHRKKREKYKAKEDE